MQWCLLSHLAAFVTETGDWPTLSHQIVIVVTVVLYKLKSASFNLSFMQGYTGLRKSKVATLIDQEKL